MGKGKTGQANGISCYIADLSADRRWQAERAGQPLDVTLIDSPELMDEAVALLRSQELVAIDFETTTYSGEYGEEYGPHAGDIRLIQVGYQDPFTGEGRQFLFDGQAVDLQPLAALLEDQQVKKVVHFCPFELAWARHHLNCDITRLQDTCFVAQSVNKELRMRVAKLLLPEAERGRLVEAQALLSKPSEGGVRRLEDGTALGDQAVASATQSVIGKLQERLRMQQGGELAEAMDDWTTQERATLAALAKRFLGEDLSKEEQASDWSAPLSRQQLDYAAADAAITLSVLPAMRHLAKILSVERRVDFRIDKQREELAQSSSASQT